MVSEKVVIILIILAILLSVISVVFTMSSMNTKLVPETTSPQGKTTDTQQGQVSIIINPPKT